MKHGRNAPFKKVANGVPGLEVRTALLFSEAVGKGRIDLPTFVALTATNAAKLYGLHPRKGTSRWAATRAWRSGTLTGK